MGKFDFVYKNVLKLHFDWVGGWVDRWTNGMDGWMDRRNDGWVVAAGWLAGGGMGGWTDGWTDG